MEHIAKHHKQQLLISGLGSRNSTAMIEPKNNISTHVPKQTVMESFDAKDPSQVNTKPKFVALSHQLSTAITSNKQGSSSSQNKSANKDSEP